MKSGPIVIIEDDSDDKEMMEDGLLEIGVQNKVVWFKNCLDAFTYLKETSEQPFIIFCDINLPKQTGVEFKRNVDADKQLRRKSIPFIFYSTSADEKTVDEVFCEMTVQGYFVKARTFAELKKDMKIIVDYWQTSRHPNTK